MRVEQAGEWRGGVSGRRYGSSMSIGSMSPTAEILRTDPELQVGELALLGQFLDYHRATLALKCVGLSDEELVRRSIPPSSLSLLGLVRHLSEVERSWFGRTLDGRLSEPLYYDEANPDGDFDSLESAPVAEVWTAYRAAVAESRRVLATFQQGEDLARGSTKRARNVRWVLAHMLEEYARHNGHADLLREQIDGATGE
jgi:uncharacterized damage-inducible protein DinB